MLALIIQSLFFTNPIPAIVVPPGPNPFSCFKPAKGINSKNGLSLSKSLAILSLVRDFPLSFALFNAISLPCK